MGRKRSRTPIFIGDIDYVFTFNTSAVICCVTEGRKKQDNLDAGVVQNIAQVRALRSTTRKRKHDKICRCYDDIVTTFVECVFIDVGDRKVCRCNMSVVVDPSKPQSICHDYQIVGLLKVCKEDAACSE
jgi:hypothetical protein